MTNPEWPDDLPELGPGGLPNPDDPFVGDDDLPELEAIAMAEMEDLADALDDAAPDADLPMPEFPVADEPELPDPPDPGAPEIDLGGLGADGLPEELSAMDPEIGLDLDLGPGLEMAPDLGEEVESPDPGDLEMADPGLADPVPPVPDEPVPELPEVDIPDPGEIDAPQISDAELGGVGTGGGGAFADDLPDLPGFGDEPSVDLPSVSVSSDGRSRTVKLTTTLELPERGL